MTNTLLAFALLLGSVGAHAAECDWKPSAEWGQLSTLSAGFVDDLKKEKDVRKPSAEFLRRYYVPLKNAVLPFDKTGLETKLNALGPAVAPNWSLSTIHRLGGSGVGEVPDVYRVKDEYFDAPMWISGVGDVLFILGHSLYETGKTPGERRGSFEKIPTAERADLLLRRRRIPGNAFLPVAKTVTPDEPIYVVSYPFLDWAPEVRGCGPLVSYGNVEMLPGRVVFTSALIHNGSSGGTLLNAKGEVVGVASASVSPLTVADIDEVPTILISDRIGENELRTIDRAQTIP